MAKAPLLPTTVALALAGLAATAAAEPVTITVYVRTSTREVPWEQQLVKQFEASHPNIKVKLIDNAGQNYQDRLAALWASGDPPDVWDHGGAVATYRYNGWLLDLNPYIRRDKAQLAIDEIFPGAWNAYVHADFAAGLPFITLPSPVWYNADMLEAAGLTRPPVSWDDRSWTYERFRDYAKKLTKVDASGKIQQWGAAFETDPTDSEAIVFPWLNGGGWFDEPGTSQTGIAHQALFNRPENIEAYQRELDLVYKDNSATFDIWGTFQQAKSAMAVTEGGWMGFGAHLKFRFGMTAQPWMKTTADPIYTDPWMISSKTKHPEEAWEFVKYVTGKEGLTSYLSIANFPPVRRSVLQPFVEAFSKETKGVMTPAEVMEGISGGEKYGHETLEHAMAGWYDLLDKVNPLLSDMFKNKISPKEAMEKADVLAAGVIQKYQAKK